MALQVEDRSQVKKGWKTYILQINISFSFIRLLKQEFMVGLWRQQVQEGLPDI